MNTKIDVDTFNLLFDKGFNEWRVNKAILELPTIADVLTWLHEKHELWIIILPTDCCYFTYKVIDVQCNPENIIERPPYDVGCAYDYRTPTEAYIDAIKECLTKTIK